MRFEVNLGTFLLAKQYTSKLDKRLGQKYVQGVISERWTLIFFSLLSLSVLSFPWRTCITFINRTKGSKHCFLKCVKNCGKPLSLQWTFSLLEVEADWAPSTMKTIWLPSQGILGPRIWAPDLASLLSLLFSPHPWISNTSPLSSHKAVVTVTCEGFPVCRGLS